MGNNFLPTRIIIAVACMAIIPLIVVLFALSFGGNKAMNEEAQRQGMLKYAEQFNQRNVDLIFYKKDPIGPENLKARRVNALNDQGLALNLYSDKAYHVLIFDDLDGSLSFNDQQGYQSQRRNEDLHYFLQQE